MGRGGYDDPRAALCVLYATARRGMPLRGTTVVGKPGATTARSRELFKAIDCRWKQKTNKQDAQTPGNENMKKKRVRMEQ